MCADGRLFVLYDYENGRICQFSLHRSRTSCPFRTACPEQECRGAGRQWRLQKATGILKHRNYLNGLQWDGNERISHVLHHFLGAEEDEYTCEAIKIFLLEAIKRVF